MMGGDLPRLEAFPFAKKKKREKKEYERAGHEAPPQKGLAPQKLARKEKRGGEKRRTLAPNSGLSASLPIYHLKGEHRTDVGAAGGEGERKKKK